MDLMETGRIIKTRFNIILTGYLSHLLQIFIDDITLGNPTVPIMDGQSESFQSLQPVQGLMTHPLSFSNENTKTFLVQRENLRFEAMPSLEKLAFLAG